MLIGVLAGFILAGAMFIVIRLPSGEPIALQPVPTKAPIQVHVVGAVVRPGLYSLPEGSRVQDAINAAGGLLSEADANTMNLAEKVEDGQQLQIGKGGLTASPTKAGSPFSVIATPKGGSTPNPDLVDINTAGLDELESLPGIGPTAAQNIINYRNQHGPFQQIEDIMNVPGIGPATFNQLQDLITAGP